MRRSNYWMAIDNQLGTPPPSVVYPIIPGDCVISQNVIVVRGSEKQGYPFLETYKLYLQRY